MHVSFSGQAWRLAGVDVSVVCMCGRARLQSDKCGKLTSRAFLLVKPRLSNMALLKSVCDAAALITSTVHKPMR